MSREIFWLTLTLAMTALFWIPYVLDRAQIRGLAGAMANPRPTDRPQSEWAQRQMRAHTNAVENLIIFAPLVLIVEILDVSSGITAMACAAYFWARLAHYVVYTMGIPVARTLAFTVGWIAQIVLILVIFGIL